MSLYPLIEAREAEMKNQSITKLIENGLISEDRRMEFKCDMINYENKRLAHMRENTRPFRYSRHRHQKIEEEFKRVHFYNFIHCVDDWLKDHLRNDGRCIQIYEDVMSAVCRSDSRREPDSKPNIRERIETPFSVSRAAPGSAKSNAELIDALALATGMKTRSAMSICGQIKWSDSIARKGISGSWMGGSGFVSGGRLGRDHMLSDVPNHFVRDRLVDYIDTQLEEEDQKEAARNAVFSDLSPAEMEQYSVLVAQKIKEKQPKELSELAKQVTGGREIKNQHERAYMFDQAEALEYVDIEIDLTPKPGFATRRFPLGCGSVYEAGQPRLTAVEADVDIGSDIDRDCDQIRAMIVRFTSETEWTVDDFRRALGIQGRPKLTKFLRDDGPNKGDRVIFELAWEFFKRRELLGLHTVEGSKDESEDESEGGDILQESSGNTKKRQSPGGDGTRKRVRKT
ncbi:hypothetical protein M426DRAFT_13877 [Hypoxylon sp. CI-4A]|nr:hypothetical protein M426DRAFT_13877 [Hypoxylon sp. CI-4A]